MHMVDVLLSYVFSTNPHADALFDSKASIEEWYKRALRLEMGLGEESESGFYDKYYNLESDLVQAQAAIHGEY